MLEAIGDGEDRAGPPSSPFSSCWGRTVGISYRLPSQVLTEKVICEQPWKEVGDGLADLRPQVGLGNSKEAAWAGVQWGLEA